MSNRSGLDWESSGDLKRLRKLAKRKLSARVIAERLGRSAGATRWIACMNGIKFRSIRRTK